MYQTQNRNRRSRKRIELAHAWLELRSSVQPMWGDDSDSDAFIIDFQGEVFATTDDASDGTEVGTLKAYLVRLDEASEAGCDWFEVLDNATEDIAKYVALINAEGSCFTDWVERTFQPNASQLLILDRIRIKPEFRGRGYGLYAAELMIEGFGAMGGLVACVPAPYELIEERRERIRQTNKEEDGPIPGWDAAQERLRQHWSLLGFERVPDSDVFALSLALRRPPIRDVITAYHNRKQATLKSTVSIQRN